MDNNELKDALEKRGKSTEGSRRAKIERYMKMETNCSGLVDLTFQSYCIVKYDIPFFCRLFGLAGRVGKHVYCSADDSCLAFSCCVNLKLFIYRHALTAFVRYDPCPRT
ncbi:hypothetical protein NP493_715g02005 [Ridgeia piscesae]|uniref:SAP domain-containing protein n=1 Tax=Ridgeia piscesae TaxID=27915 RepID=A0AAD9NMQ3_RIDPI|nr:hypothetical protein NP493_715g02005 [Ridgeia piscesae]